MKYMTIDDALKTKYTVSNLPAYLATKKMPSIHRGNKKQAYYDMIVAFDIEASSFVVNEQPKATMYIWMMAIDGTFFYGRTWDEWNQFMNILNAWLCKGKYTQMICHVCLYGYRIYHMNISGLESVSVGKKYLQQMNVKLFMHRLCFIVLSFVVLIFLVVTTLEQWERI